VTTHPAAAKCGISVCLHRFQSFENQMSQLSSFYEEKTSFDKKNEKNECFVSVGLSDLEKTKRELSILKTIGHEYVCLDIANAYLPQLADFANVLKELNYKPKLMIGNVHTKQGIQYLYELFNLTTTELNIRVGIGGGSPCITASSTGINRGNITEIVECSEEKYYLEEKTPVNIIADGGIKDASYACKAFAAGADYVCMGGFFMNAEEAESNISGDGSYWGGASEKQMKLVGIDVNEKHPEGKVIEKDSNKVLIPLNKLVNNLWGGIASYVTYSGKKSLYDAIGEGTFEIKQNSLPPKNR
jgi:GMP reductase